jgi:sulfur carrier protein
MEITLNNHPYTLDKNRSTTVLDLVEQKFPDSQKGIAVAVGEEVLPREEWENYILKENEKLFIFKAIQGG